MVEFYYQVIDDSMSGDRIHNGDLVLIRETQSILPNEISAIAYDSDVSRLVCRRVVAMPDSKYLLIPSGPEWKPEIKEDVVIIGKVIKQILY